VCQWDDAHAEETIEQSSVPTCRRGQSLSRPRSVLPFRSAIAWISGSSRIRLCGTTTARPFAVIENYRLMLCANWRRSWTLTFAVHGKRMWWMLISYSTPSAPGAKSRYLWSSGYSLHVLDRTHSAHTVRKCAGAPDTRCRRSRARTRHWCRVGGHSGSLRSKLPPVRNVRTVEELLAPVDRPWRLSGWAC
jgi:hypothetical protein